MFGLWLGINMVLPCIIIYWLINPAFLFTQKQKSRWEVLCVVFIWLTLDLLALVLMAMLDYDLSAPIDVTAFFVSMMAGVGVNAWLFYRHGQRSAPSHATILGSTTHHDVSISPSVSICSPAPSESDDHPPEDTPPPLKTTEATTPDDWQSYKQKMEQSWADTRTKLAKKSKPNDPK